MVYYIRKGEWVTERHHTNSKGKARHWVGPSGLVVTRTSECFNMRLDSTDYSAPKIFNTKLYIIHYTYILQYVHHYTVHILRSMSIVSQTTYYDWRDSIYFWKYRMCTIFFWPICWRWRTVCVGMFFALTV